MIPSHTKFEHSFTCSIELMYAIHAAIEFYATVYYLVIC